MCKLNVHITNKTNINLKKTNILHSIVIHLYTQDTAFSLRQYISLHYII